MGSRAQYVMKIGGRLKEKLGATKLDKISDELNDIFKKIGSGTGAFSNEPGDTWPKGFILVNYTVCQWELWIDQPYKPKHPEDKAKYQNYSEEVMVTFRAEIHHKFDGSLFLNRFDMLPDVSWFYNYRKYQWHKDLTKRLAEFHEKYKDSVIEKVWFRDWQWYCGNGGC